MNELLTHSLFNHDKFKKSILLIILVLKILMAPYIIFLVYFICSLMDSGDIGVTSDKILRNGKIKRNVIEVELPYTIDAINVTKYFAKCCVDVNRVMKHLSSIVDVKNIQFKRVF